MVSPTPNYVVVTWWVEGEPSCNSCSTLLPARWTRRRLIRMQTKNPTACLGHFQGPSLGNWLPQKSYFLHLFLRWLMNDKSQGKNSEEQKKSKVRWNQTEWKVWQVKSLFRLTIPKYWARTTAGLVPLQPFDSSPGICCAYYAPMVGKIKKWPEKLRRYAPTKESLVEPYLSINQHQ